MARPRRTAKYVCLVSAHPNYLRSRMRLLGLTARDVKLGKPIFEGGIHTPLRIMTDAGSALCSVGR